MGERSTVGTSLTAQVVKAAMRGESSALHEVYAQLAPKILGYLRARGAGDPEAVTHDVFLALLPQLPRLRGGPSGLRTLAFSIAHARLVDELRGRSANTPPVRYEPAEDRRVVQSAETRVHERMATDAVCEVLARLPDDQREVLILRIVADLSLEQAARVMGRSVGAVKQLQRRGVLALRRILADGGTTP